MSDALDNARAALATIKKHPWINDRTCAWLKVDRPELVATRDALEALIAEHERLVADRDEWKRLFSECHPVHLDGVLRAQEAEARIAKALAAPHFGYSAMVASILRGGS